MRTLIALAGLLSLALISCNTGNPSPQNRHTHYLKDSTFGRLYKLEQARVDIDSFYSMTHHEFSAALDGKSPKVYAFTISSADLFAAMGMAISDTATLCAYQYCRAYMGYNAKEGYKLFIVPVAGTVKPSNCDSAGYDLMLDNTGKAVDTADHNYSKQYVLDLNAPCPCICDRKSPLVANLKL